MMRVLRVSNAGGYGRVQYGGAERGLVQQSRAVRAAGIDLHVVVPSGELADTLEAEGVPVHRAGPLRRIDRDYVRLLTRLLQEGSYDVVHLQLLSASVHGRIAARLAGFQGPLIVSLHNDLIEILRATPSSRDRLKVVSSVLIERLADSVRSSVHVAVAEPEAQSLRKWQRYSRVVTLPNELPPGWRRPSDRAVAAFRRQWKIAPQELIIGAFMRLEASKGVDILWGAVDELPGRMLVCGNGICTPPATRKVAAWIPRADDVSLAMAACDLIVVPSKWEAFGRTAVEALALEIPVLHSGVGGLPWVTRGVDASMAASFTATDAGEFVRAVHTQVELIRSGVTGKHSSDAAALMRKRFGFEACARLWIELYGGLYGDTKRND